MLELLQGTFFDAVSHETVNQGQYMILKSFKEICDLVMYKQCNEFGLAPTSQMVQIELIVSY